jgi:hypothetical protein
LAAISEPYFSASFLVLTQIVTKETMQQPLTVPSEPSLGRRRRKRQEEPVQQIKKEIIPALPPLSAEDYGKIRELAAQVAGETAQRFVEALPMAVLGKLSPDGLEACGRELAGQLEPSLSAQLSWALNQAWQEAGEY